MEGAEAGLLQKGRLSQELFSRRVIAGSSRLLRRIDDGLSVARVRHEFPVIVSPRPQLVSAWRRNAYG